MTDPLADPLADLWEILADPERLVRAVASGGRRGRDDPPWRRVECRPVLLADGSRLQVVTFDSTQSFTANHPWADAGRIVEGLLGHDYATWVVEWSQDGQGHRRTLRYSRKGRPLVHDEVIEVRQRTEHDRAKPRLLDPAHPVLVAVGISRPDGRIRADRQDKFRQVEQFLRLLDVDLRGLPSDRPLRIVDLGCGNAYLTFAAAAWLSSTGREVRLHGVDTRASARDRNTAIAAAAGLGDRVTFSAEPIADSDAVAGADVVLALHACDTATDDALAVAVRAEVPVILAAPCCHHDLAAQLARAVERPAWAGGLLRDGILRERLADVLTDAVRADLLRAHGYRVEAVEFVESRHTPRNTLLRAHRTGRVHDDAAGRVEELMQMWQVTPHLAELLASGHIRTDNSDI